MTYRDSQNAIHDRAVHDFSTVSKPQLAKMSHAADRINFLFHLWSGPPSSFRPWRQCLPFRKFGRLRSALRNQSVDGLSPINYEPENPWESLTARPRIFLSVLIRKRKCEVRSSRRLYVNRTDFESFKGEAHVFRRMKMCRLTKMKQKVNFIGCVHSSCELWLGIPWIVGLPLHGSRFDCHR